MTDGGRVKAPRSSYDVVVVGASMAALAAAALLARRGFRVAVVGHDSRPQTYAYDGLPLRRDHNVVTFAETPAFRRVVSELALLPTVRRRLRPLDPLFQVALPGHRVDVSARAGVTVAELRREFPEVERPVEDFYAALERHAVDLDAALGSDLAWPPHGFFERREAARVARGLSALNAASGDPLAEFAASHPFRTFVEAPTRFAVPMDPDRMGVLARLRALDIACRSAWFADGGIDGLKRLFEEKIQQHGGDLRLRDQIETIHTRRGRVVSVALAGIDEVLGCGFVVSSLAGVDALRLTGTPAGSRWSRHLLGVRPRAYRYVLNVVVPANCLPMGMASRVFTVADASRPLAEENLLAVESSPPDEKGRVVLTVVALLPRAAVDEGGGYLRRVRARVLRALGGLVPFLDRHILVVDSPHDGHPLEDRVRGTEVTLDARWSGAAEPMEAIDRVDEPGYLGVCGLPCRADTEGMLLCGRQVVPGLGTEGEFLAALTVARIITRTDRSKERLRRELWSKVEA